MTVRPEAPPARGRVTPELVAVVVAVAAGVTLRFVTSSALWLDEALTVHVARLPLADIPAALERDGLPPLHYVLLHGWMALFGDGDLAVRSLSGVVGVACLPLAYLAGRRLGGNRLGGIALVLFALNPFAIRYATEARMYSLLILLGLAGFLVVDAGLRRPAAPALVGTALVTALGLYTHYWAIFAIGAALVVLGFVAWRERGEDRGRAAQRLVLAMLVGCLAFVPWLGVFLGQSAHTGTPWAAASRPTELLTLTLMEMGGGELTEATLLGASILTVLFLLGLFGVAHGRWSIELDLRTVPPARGVAAMGILGLLFGALATLVTDTGFAPRYGAIAVPFLLLVMAVGADRFDDRLVRDLVVAGVAVLGLGISLHQAREQRTQAPDLAAAIEAGDPSGASVGSRPVVVYCPDQLGPAVHRLLPGETFDEVIFPNLDSTEVDSPARVDWYDYADRQESVPPEQVAAAILERAGPENAIWVVHNSSYLTPGSRCRELVDALGKERFGVPVVTADPEEFFEHADLQLYPAVEP